MKLIDLVTLLNSLNLPVAHSHFKKTNQSPLPNPPYITYVTPNDQDFKADNINYHKMTDVDIELYTEMKDLQIEEALESLLTENEIAYNAFQVYIDSEQMFQKVYEIRLI